MKILVMKERELGMKTMILLTQHLGSDINQFKQSPKEMEHRIVMF